MCIESSCSRCFAQLLTLDQAIQLPQLEYAGGSLLTILLEDGRLVNAQVSRQVEWNRFAIKVDGQDQDQLVELNEANHVQGHCADFDSKAYLKYCAIQRDRFRITCRKMDVETQVIYIDTAVESATVQTPDIKSLADLLLGADGERFKGQQLIYRCLMIAGPGTGKTWSSCQLMYHLSKACSARSVLTGIVKMPTLIFAQKIADPEAEEPAAKKAKKGKKAPVEKDLSTAALVDDEEEAEEIPDAIQVFMNNEKSGSSSVSEMLKNDEFQKLMDEVRERKDEQPALELGKQLSEEDTEYPLITRCNSLVREIDDEMMNIHRFVRDIYSKKFPELESIVTSPLDYLQVVQRIGNTKDLTTIDFSDILPNTAVMAITVTASMTAGTQLPRQELDKMLVGCDEAFLLNDCKRDVLLYLESRMSGLAPNLSALLGAALAAKLITAAGGLLNLARMPAQNIILVGSQKKSLLGMGSGAYSTQGIIFLSDLIVSTPMEFRNRAVKLVAGKCGLAARVDSFHESPLGQVGTQLREKILQSLAKAQEPPPAKQKKTLPPPEDRPRAKRGGKRHRRIKEKYGQSEFKKMLNRTKFGVDPEDNIYTEEWGLGLPYFEGKPVPLKAAKVSKEKQLQRNIQAMKRQRAAASAGNESGLSSSLAFTPVQGIELANPSAQRKAPDVGEKYFSNSAGFVNLYGQEYCAVLVRALRLRSAIVLLDGIDEASDVKGVLQSYIMRRLVPMEISLVLTSRPEGVSADLSTLKQSFAIMSLKPLSDKQQKDIILNQELRMLECGPLSTAEDIRAKHDLIYYHEAFPDPKDRRYMEKQLPAVNRFKKEDGSWDPTMVQHLKGQVIKAIPTGTAPSSAYLKAASGYFTGELFRVMDKLLKEKKPTADLDAVLKELGLESEAISRPRKVTNNQDLWSKVVCNTDQLLTAAEDFKPVFEKAVDALCKYVQEELKKTAQEGQQISYDYDLVLGPLKDPVRVCEKAGLGRNITIWSMAEGCITVL
eukprot:g11313.t1